jgi:hypothetical protein
MSANMPKPFSGSYGPGQGLGAGYVNPQPVRLVGADQRELLNPYEASARRGQARGSDVGKRNINTDVGGR